MCIQYCDDGDSSAVRPIVDAIRTGKITALDAVKFLNYEFTDEDTVEAKIKKMIRRCDRNDTIEYIRWHHSCWMTDAEFNEWFSGLL